ncbi:Cohesin domain-containing protein [Pseudobutyrivibrio sp. UC1225]|nr:Cohesin domain-containing protein [Pseudobutyrivibrio sp. UC1225]
MMNKNLRRAVVLGMAAITLLTGIPATPVLAAEKAPVHTLVQSTGKGDSQKVTVKVTLDKTTVTDGRVAVEYDPAVLELKSDSEGIKFADADVNKAFEDGASKGVAYAFVGDAPKSVKGTLMTVQFTVKKGLQSQKTTIGTKVYGINNEEAAVVEETVLEDVVEVGRPKLKKPSISGIDQTLLGVLVRWNKDANADGYVVYRSTSKNGKYTKLATVSGVNGYWNLSVENNKTYYYKVVSYQGSGKDRVYSEESAPVSIKVKKFFGLFG